MHEAKPDGFMFFCPETGSGSADLITDDRFVLAFKILKGTEEFLLTAVGLSEEFSTVNSMGIPGEKEFFEV